MIQVKTIEGKGRGIIATKDITQGDVIEVAPVVAFPDDQKKAVDQTILFKYYFVRSTEYNDSKDSKGYVIFGLASICNHTQEPNSYVDWIEDDIGIWSHLIAKKDITAGEEVTLYYTNIGEY